MKTYKEFLTESDMLTEDAFSAGKVSVLKTGAFQIGSKMFIPGNKDKAFAAVLKAGKGQAMGSIFGKTAGIKIDDTSAYFEYDGEREILSGAKFAAFKKYLGH